MSTSASADIAPRRATSLREFWELRAQLVGAMVAQARRPANYSGTVVCKYWLKDRCVAGDVCPWLHVYDHRRLPVCGYIEKRQPCPDGAMCVFKH